MDRERGRTIDAVDTGIRPRAPLFTASIDEARAAVRVRGHLDRIGADMLCRSVEGLRSRGHRRLTVELRPPATVDPEAWELLAGLADRLAADGVRLDVH
ncbi:hypothetical protein [Geodermatophilus ruber]|uniref:STAS domain-containing protein n=1 Tax=Geodermatophilus ruber TaxID=504800 RepID=A0A1I4DVY8_9ACTN|nr:hypothetical protein [Geodermatophilus ruber]SFK97762.1 hypothetical protein SAMN04488085_10584 [Geodermatophilus ruber]